MKNKTLVPVCRCNKCMTYFHEEVTTCPKCNTDGYLMDMPELAAAGDMAEALAEVRDMLESSAPTEKRKADIHFIVTAALAKAGR